MYFHDGNLGYDEAQQRLCGRSINAVVLSIYSLQTTVTQAKWRLTVVSHNGVLK